MSEKEPEIDNKAETIDEVNPQRNTLPMVRTQQAVRIAVNPKLPTLDPPPSKGDTIPMGPVNLRNRELPPLPKRDDLLQKRAAAIRERTLGIGEVPPETTFLALPGDSLPDFDPSLLEDAVEPAREEPHTQPGHKLVTPAILEEPPVKGSELIFTDTGTDAGSDPKPETTTPPLARVIRRRRIQPAQSNALPTLPPSEIDGIFSLTPPPNASFEKPPEHRLVEVPKVPETLSIEPAPVAPKAVVAPTAPPRKPLPVGQTPELGPNGTMITTVPKSQNRVRLALIGAGLGTLLAIGAWQITRTTNQEIQAVITNTPEQKPTPQTLDALRTQGYTLNRLSCTTKQGERCYHLTKGDKKIIVTVSAQGDVEEVPPDNIQN